MKRFIVGTRRFVSVLYTAGLAALLIALFAGQAFAQSYKMLAPTSNQQEFYGVVTLIAGSASVNVLPNGTVTAATASLNTNFKTGTGTPTLVVTKSGGSITIQAYDEAGINTAATATVFYNGAGSQ